MKKIILPIAAALMATSAYSTVISPEQALARVRTSSAAHRIKAANTSALSLAKTFTANSQPAVYLFSRGDYGGYIVLSADDNADALLGYCDEGTIDINNIPPAMAYLIQSYADQIAFARANAPQKIVAKSNVSPSRDAIHPMTTTKWGLSAPFSNLCPNQYQTGCVATALAQVLKYHNFPTQGSGVMSYTWNDQTLSFDLDQNPFKWDDMLDEYNDQATDAQINAVAELMYACGVAVQMNYKSGGSGAYPINGISNLVNNFGVDKGIRYYNRDYYGCEEWNNLIYDALKNCGPVMLGGCIMYGSYVYSHEFVCDGYSDDNLFHINWGWNGQYNGYFRLTALDIYANGYAATKYSYNYYQDALCYIQPPVAGSAVYEQVYCTNFNPQYTSAKLGNRQKINYTCYNYSGAPLSGTMGIKLSDLDGNVLLYLEGTTSFSDIAIASSVGQYYFYLPSDLAEGAYTMSPVFRGSDGEWHDVRCKMGACQSYTVTVTDGKAYFTEDGAATYSVSDFNVATPIYNCNNRTIPFLLTAKLSCPSKMEYFGKISAAFYDLDGNKVSTLSYVPLYLPAEETTDFEFYDTVSGLTEGATYQVALVDASGNAVSDFQQVTIASGRISWTGQVSNIIVENSEAVDKHQIVVHFDATCTSGYMYEQLNLSVYDKNKKSVASWPVYPVALSNGQTRSFTVRADMADAENGATYYFNIVSAISSKVVSSESTYFTIADECSGVSDITTNATQATDAAQPIEYYNLQGIKVATINPATTSSANPATTSSANAVGNLAPGLYIVRQGNTVSKLHVR